MNQISKLFRRILFFFKRNRFDSELREELRFHLEMKVEDNLSSGMSVDDAQYSAKRRLGNTTRIQETSREVWLLRNVEILGQDLRYALRSLSKHKSFTAVVVITLALGIGANTAIFTVIKAALFGSMPYRQPSRLVQLVETRDQKGLDGKSINHMEASYPDYVDWKNQSHSFESVAAYVNWGASYTLAGSGEPERIEGSRVTGTFFSLLGVEPALGRNFRPDEENSDAGRNVILSHGLWQRKFGGDPGVIGRSVRFDSTELTVIGVLPQTFRFALAGNAQMWTLVPNSQSYSKLRYMHWMNVIARLKSDITPEQAKAEMSVIGSAMANQFPDSHTGASVRMVSLESEILGDVKTLLLVLWGSVGLVLLIACVNVANLLLSRSTTRRKEIAVRLVIGANRARVIRQLLTESLMLSLFGGAAGFALAIWGVRLLIAAIPSTQMAAMPYLQSLVRGTRVDVMMLAFTVGVSFVIGIGFGLAPAFQTTNIDLRGSLTEAGRSSTSFVGQRLRKFLVVFEIALSLILLIGAGLLIKSTSRLLNVSLGFNPTNVAAMKISMPQSRYKTFQQRMTFTRQLIERVNSIPGVSGSAMMNYLPFGGEVADELNIEGQPKPEHGTEPMGNERIVSSDYFRMMGIPLIKGRYFTDKDGNPSARVAIVNQTLVSNLLPGADPIGRYLVTEGVKYEIVGMVGDERVGKIDQKATNVLYLPDSQNGPLDTCLFVRTNVPTNADALAAAIRKEMRAIDPDVPLYSSVSIEKLITETPEAFIRRYPAFLMGIFAAIAFLLALVGIYGVTSYSVTQQTREIGIRIAMGAQHNDVFRHIAGSGMMLAGLGVVLGLIGAFLMTRVLSGFLFGVTATDPWIFIMVSLALSTVAFAACCIPARRAMRTDPMIALRHE